MLRPLFFWNSWWKLLHSLHICVFRNYLVFHSPYLIYTLHFSVVSLYSHFIQGYLIYYLFFLPSNLGKPDSHLMVISYAYLKWREKTILLINVYLDYCRTRNTPLWTCGILLVVLRSLFVGSNYTYKKCFIFWRYIKNIGSSALQRQNYKIAGLKIIASATDATSCPQMGLALMKEKCKCINFNKCFKKTLSISLSIYNMITSDYSQLFPLGFLQFG